MQIKFYQKLIIIDIEIDIMYDIIFHMYRDNHMTHQIVRLFSINIKHEKETKLGKLKFNFLIKIIY